MTETGTNEQQDNEQPDIGQLQCEVDSLKEILESLGISKPPGRAPELSGPAKNTIHRYLRRRLGITAAFTFLLGGTAASLLQYILFGAAVERVTSVAQSLGEAKGRVEASEKMVVIAQEDLNIVAADAARKVLDASAQVAAAGKRAMDEIARNRDDIIRVISEGTGGSFAETVSRLISSKMTPTHGTFALSGDAVSVRDNESKLLEVRALQAPVPDALTQCVAGRIQVAKPGLLAVNATIHWTNEGITSDEDLVFTLSIYVAHGDSIVLMAGDTMYLPGGNTCLQSAAGFAYANAGDEIRVFAEHTDRRGAKTNTIMSEGTVVAVTGWHGP